MRGDRWGRVAFAAVILILMFTLMSMLSGLVELLLLLGVAAVWIAWGVRGFVGGMARVPRSYYMVLRLVGSLLPRRRARDWAEEMQNQLSDKEVGKRQRRIMLTDVLYSAPMLWMTTWTLHRQQTRALSRHGNSLLLVAQLRGALEPYGRGKEVPAGFSDRLFVMRTLGLSRTVRWRTRTVPTLQLARRLLDTEQDALRPARTAARQLLHTREQAHRIARDLRRTGQIRDDGQHRQLDLLRGLALRQAADLQTELDGYIHIGRMRP